MLRLEFKEKTYGSLDADFRKQVNDIFNEAASDAVAELKALSPVGATGELQEMWRYIPARRETVTFTTVATIVNNASNVESRIFGRGPGLAPPIEPLERWIEAKQTANGNGNGNGNGRKAKLRSRAVALSKKIAREGTERYKEGSNPFGLTPSGGFLQGSPMSKCEEQIRVRLKKIKLDR